MRGFVEYAVTINVQLAPGATIRSAEIDADTLGHHTLHAYARSHHQATKRALDDFHDTNPIGFLEDVIITTRTRKYEE